uniref:Uncharacterized protein n=1 Tax=Steinernema glaseri TaxID=37863 RepID=A0A1I7Z7C9_9BILA
MRCFFARRRRIMGFGGFRELPTDSCRIWEFIRAAAAKTRRTGVPYAQPDKGRVVKGCNVPEGGEIRRRRDGFKLKTKDISKTPDGPLISPRDESSSAERRRRRCKAIVYSKDLFFAAFYPTTSRDVILQFAPKSGGLPDSGRRLRARHRINRRPSTE